MTPTWTKEMCWGILYWSNPNFRAHRSLSFPLFISLATRRIFTAGNLQEGPSRIFKSNSSVDGPCKDKIPPKTLHCQHQAVTNWANLVEITLMDYNCGLLLFQERWCISKGQLKIWKIYWENCPSPEITVGGCNTQIPSTLQSLGVEPSAPTIKHEIWFPATCLLRRTQGPLPALPARIHVTLSKEFNTMAEI